METNENVPAIVTVRERFLEFTDINYTKGATVTNMFSFTEVGSGITEENKTRRRKNCELS